MQHSVLFIGEGFVVCQKPMGHIKKLPAEDFIEWSSMRYWIFSWLLTFSPHVSSGSSLRGVVSDPIVYGSYHVKVWWVYWTEQSLANFLWEIIWKFETAFISSCDCRGNIKGIIASLESLVTYILLVVWYASFVHFSTSHLILRN